MSSRWSAEGGELRVNVLVELVVFAQEVFLWC